MLNQSALLVVAISCLTVCGCSKSPIEIDGKSFSQNQTAISQTENLNAQTEQKPIPIEIQIHDFTQQVGEEYTSNYGIEKGEALAAIAASKKFKMSIIDVSRAHDLIENQKAGWNISPAELDQMNIKRFKDLGFIENNGTWYFDGQAVDMGTPLPPPVNIH